MGISGKDLGEDELVVVRMREHPKALVLPLLVLLLTSLVTVVVTGLLPESARGPVSALVGVVALGVAVWFVARPVVVWATTSYVITDRHLLTRSGLPTHRGHAVPLSRVTDVGYELGLVDRVFGCGTLVVSEATEPGQIRLHDVPDVQRVQLLLSDLVLTQHRPGP